MRSSIEAHRSAVIGCGHRPGTIDVQSNVAEAQIVLRSEIKPAVTIYIGLGHRIGAYNHVSKPIAACIPSNHKLEMVAGIESQKDVDVSRCAVVVRVEPLIRAFELIDLRSEE